MNYVKQYWRIALSVWIAFVFVQSLFFKFTGSLETDYIFGTLAEWSGISAFAFPGPYVIGGAELIASILLFTRFWAFGSAMAFGIIVSAIFFHLFTPLGIQMPVFDESGEIIGKDGGTLFVMACLVALSAAAITFKDLREKSGQIRSLLKF